MRRKSVSHIRQEAARALLAALHDICIAMDNGERSPEEMRLMERARMAIAKANA